MWAGASVRSVSSEIPTREGVLAAATRVAGRIVRTPLLPGRGERRLLLKAEVLQRTGSFKIRGALNFVGALGPEQRSRGVVAYSSGNHAQGVAAAAAEYGIGATIVMPSDAPPIKLRNTRRAGATVVAYDRRSENREEIAARIAAETGATIIPPYDHRLTVEGQGTLGLELLEDLGALGIDSATVVVPASGGGLAAGIALAVDGQHPVLSVVVAEPADHDDHRRSIVAGERVEVRPETQSICDALLQPTPGAITWEVNRRLLAGAVTASDGEVLAAMRWAVEESRLVVEPGGAVGLAAYLADAVPGEGPVVVVLSGGNVDPALLVRALS